MHLHFLWLGLLFLYVNAFSVSPIASLKEKIKKKKKKEGFCHPLFTFKFALLGLVKKAVIAFCQITLASYSNEKFGYFSHFTLFIGDQEERKRKDSEAEN